MPSFSAYVRSVIFRSVRQPVLAWSGSATSYTFPESTCLNVAVPILQAGNDRLITGFVLRPWHRSVVRASNFVSTKEKTMFDPPNQLPGTLERKVELEQTVDYAIQVLVEEACLLGWTPAES